MYQSLRVRNYSKNLTLVKIKKVRHILLYQTYAFLIGGRNKNRTCMTRVNGF